MASPRKKSQGPSAEANAARRAAAAEAADPLAVWFSHHFAMLDRAGAAPIFNRKASRNPIFYPSPSTKNNRLTTAFEKHRLAMDCDEVCESCMSYVAFASVQHPGWRAAEQLLTTQSETKGLIDPASRRVIPAVDIWCP